MNTTVLQADPADVIAYTFYRIGYRPRECLVLVGLRGEPPRIGVTVRADLPGSGRGPSGLDGTLKVLRDEGSCGVVAMVVSDRPWRAGRPPHQRLARDVHRLLVAAGLGVHDVLAVGRSAWRSYLCDDAACCPAAGRPLAEVESSRVAAWMVADGRVLAPDERSLLAYVDPVPPEDGMLPPEHLTAAEALRRWRELLTVGAGSPAPVRDVRWLAESLQDRWFRDAVLLTLVPDSGTVPEEVLAGVDAASVDGLFDGRPDHDLLRRGTEVLAAVARSSPEGLRADALALLAWASWWAGDGPRGRLLAARALADQPGHTLAALVDQLLFVGVPPAWIRDDCASAS